VHSSVHMTASSTCSARWQSIMPTHALIISAQVIGYLCPPGTTQLQQAVGSGRPVGPRAAARAPLTLQLYCRPGCSHPRVPTIDAASTFVCLVHVHGCPCLSGKWRQAAAAGGSSGRPSLDLHCPALCQAHPCMPHAFAVGDFKSANCPQTREEPSAEDPNNHRCQPICTSNTLSAAALQLFSLSRLDVRAILSPWAPAADSQACTRIASPHQ
jgi:hypothetical protein